MRTSRPSLLPLFRSQTQLDVLTVVLSSHEELTISEIASRISAPVSTVSREIRRLADAGLVTLRSRGRTRLVSPASDVPWMGTLAALLDQTVGVAATVESAFADVPGVDAVWIHGSWAARQSGVTGPPPRDLDLLVVGEPSALDLAAARRRIETQTRLHADVRVVSRDEWEHPPTKSFLASVREGTMVQVADAGTAHG